MTAGGVPFTCFARGATVFTNTIFCVKTRWATVVASALMEEQQRGGVRLTQALLAKVSSGAGGTVLGTPLTAATGE